MSRINVQSMRDRVITHLATRGFLPRDADGTDFAKVDSTIRFKVGTSYGEVAVTTWSGSVRVGPAVRINADAHFHDFVAHVEEWDV